LRREGQQRLDTAHRISDAIPFGQPILVGHHSEGRHRRDLKRIETNHRKGFAMLELAEKIERRLKNPSGAISSDDPEAVQKLKRELEYLEAFQEEMKAVNQYFREKGTLEGCPGSPWLIEKAAQYFKFSGEGKPFPGYATTNNAANIRRIKKRIEYLNQLKSREERPDIVGKGFRITEDKEQNRIILKLEVRLSKEDFRFVRSQGWLWSPTRTAFVRQLNGRSQWQADYIAGELKKRIPQ
jgi:hypothetical protein